MLAYRITHRARQTRSSADFARNVLATMPGLRETRPVQNKPLPRARLPWWRAGQGGHSGRVIRSDGARATSTGDGTAAKDSVAVAGSVATVGSVAVAGSVATA
ncbi:MAG TPA: hypothetical protein VE673_08455, partial [Pseudonocardiaceae bacterium]|nr:hypothetical protein [Pseudonocardiaceae bacterium]